MTTALATLALALWMAALPALAMANDTPRNGSEQKQFSIASVRPHLAIAAMSNPPRQPGGMWSISPMAKGERAARSGRSPAEHAAAEPMRAWLAWAHYTVARD